MNSLIINTSAVILAAGQGTRMKSAHPKVLHRILGLPMISYLTDTLKTISIPDILAVVGYQAEKVREAVGGEGVRFVIQEPQQGTGHAVQVAMPAVPPETETVLVLCGDVPLISPESIRNLYDLHQQSGAAVTVQTVELPDGAHYGRVVRDEKGRVMDVLQSKDAHDRPEILAIREINTGAYCFDAAFLRLALGELAVSPVTGEIYLTDMIKLARQHGREVAALLDPDWENLLGINSRQELAEATRTMKRRINEGHMSRGVTLVDPESAYIGPQVAIGRDTVVYPNVYLEGKTEIGEDCRLEPQVFIRDSQLADGVIVKMGSVIEESRIGPGADVGPMARLRPGSDLRARVHIGNFVEVKKSVLHEGVKAGHLTYLGDAEVGAGANVGAGTITCNYDGVRKHKTVIEEGAFIGSNTALVAPVTIGAGAYVGAGSTITKEVPPGKLGIARAKQVVLTWRLMGKKTEITREAEPLSAASLAQALQDLGLTCATEAVKELHRLLEERDVRTVGELLRVATPENLALVKQMCAMEGEEPSTYDLVANLANLASSLKKS